MNINSGDGIMINQVVFSVGNYIGYPYLWRIVFMNSYVYFSVQDSDGLTKMFIVDYENAIV